MWNWMDQNQIKRCKRLIGAFYMPHKKINDLNELQNHLIPSQWKTTKISY